VHDIARDTAITAAAMAAGAWLWSPGRPQIALAVLAGGALVGLSMWAIGGVVNGLMMKSDRGEIRPVSRAFPLVKFFTRHAILALTAYVMMVRLHLDPVGMFVGVTSVVIAAAVSAARTR
jgi:hypothetical protein